MKNVQWLGNNLDEIVNLCYPKNSKKFISFEQTVTDSLITLTIKTKSNIYVLSYADLICRKYNTIFYYKFADSFKYATGVHNDKSVTEKIIII
jgi:hypothetical protein